MTRTGVLGLTTVGNLVARTASSVILTRLLSPTEFGIVGIITSIFVAVAMITDLGFVDFLVRHERTEDGHFRDVIWTIHAKRGVLVSASVILTSPLIAWVLGKPALTYPLAVASLIFVFNGISSLSLITALRRDKSRELSLLDFGLQLLQTAACVMLALWWQNAWAIIAALLIQSAVRAFLSYRLFPAASHRIATDPAISREFLSFSRVVLTSSALALIIGQSDKMVLGRILTLNEFGLYAIALTIATSPTAFAESYVNRIVFPLCSKASREAPQELARVYYNVMRPVARLYAFACGGLLGSAPLAVALLYDPRYASASMFVSVLMISSALRLPNVAAAQLMIAVSQVRKTMYMTVVRFVWVIVAIPVGLALYGPFGVVIAVGFIEVPATLYSWILLRRLNILAFKEEVTYLGLIAGGALIGWIGATQIMDRVPNL